MIATSEISMPYSRRLFFRKPRVLARRRRPRSVEVAALHGLDVQAAWTLLPDATMARMIFSCDASAAGELGDEAPLVHHVDAVAHAEQLRHSEEIMRMPLPSLASSVDDGVDLVLGADVDAARRLVEDQQLGLGEQPLAQHHLLLVAARQVDHPLVHAGQRMLQRAPVLARRPRTRGRRRSRRARHAARGWPGVMLLRMSSSSTRPAALAVLGDVGDAVVDGLADRARRRPPCRACSTAPLMRWP